MWETDEGRVRKLKAPYFFFSVEANGNSISVCVYNFSSVQHQKFNEKGNCIRLRKKG